MLSDFLWLVGDGWSRTGCWHYPLPPLPPPIQPNFIPPQPSPPAPRPRLSRHRLVFLFYLSFLWLVLSDGAFFHLGWVPARALLAGWPLAFCLAGGLAGWPDRPLHDAPFTSSSLSFHLSFLSPFLAFPLLASPIFQALSAAP